MIRKRTSFAENYWKLPAFQWTQHLYSLDVDDVVVWVCREGEIEDTTHKKTVFKIGVILIVAGVLRLY